MLNRMTWALALAAVAGVAVLVWAFGPAAPVGPAEGRPVADVEYSAGLRMDLCVPPGDGPFPAVICLHGGGWTGGDRKQWTQTLAVLARRGFVAAAPQMRLAPKHSAADMLDDVRAAAAWLRSRPEYKIDPKRVGVMGRSSGGHLALLAAATRPADFQAVAAFSAPVDLADPAMHAPDLLTKNLIPLLGGKPAERADAYRAASPLWYDLKGMPPVFLAHGSDDRLVPLAHVQAFKSKVGAADGRCHLIVMEGEGHAWRGANLLRGIDKILTFLDETLKK